MKRGHAAALVGGLLLLTAPASGARPLAIYPVPHTVTMRTGTVRVTPTVTIVAGPAADPAAVALVRQTLTSSGAAVRRTAEMPHAGRNLVVIVGRDRSAERTLAVKNAGDLPSGGYVLVAGTAHGRPTVVLDGADAAGEYYAAQTLGQLLENRQALPALAIRDWPSFPRRGVVEGFYGLPWSDAARTSAVDYLARHKLNLYMYLPKDDPSVRTAWRTPLTQAQLKAFGAIAKRAAREHVTFNYGVSPGDSICYTSPTDEAAVVDKFRSLARVGIRSFTIALDDIDEDRFLCSSDIAAFGDGTTALASAQASLVNNVAAALRNVPGAQLTLVPTEYSGLLGTPYQGALATQVNPDVTIQWTGRYVVSMSITAADAANARQLYAHPLVIWDNYFVNDLLPGFLVLGPYAGRQPAIARAAEGIVIDPMAQPEASKFALFTAADFAWNARVYDPERSWSAALDELAGGDARARAALQTFAEANYGSPVAADQSPSLNEAITTFWKEWQAGDQSAADRLAPVFRKLQDAPATLRARLKDPAFLADTEPWLQATELWGTAAVDALDLMVARNDGDLSRSASDEAGARDARQRATLMNLPGTQSSIRVAGGLLSEFVHYALRGYGP